MHSDSAGFDSDIARVLEKRRQAGRPPLWLLTPSQARDESAARAAAGGAGLPAPDGIEVTDFGIPLPGRALRARRYNSDPTGDTAIVFFHGGGFVTGNLDTHDRQARMLCRETGSIVVSIDYRLAPEHPFPAAYDDGVASVQWVYDNLPRLSGQHDIHLRRVAVAGSSAGANLAAGAARALAGTDAAPVAQLLVYPFLGGGDDLPSRTAMAEGYGLTARSVDWYFSHYIPSHRDRSDPRFAPLAAPSFDGLPPTVISAARFDPLHDDATVYAERLRTAGVFVELLDNPRLNHGFWGLTNQSREAAAAAVEMCARFQQLLYDRVQESKAMTTGGENR